MAKQPKRSKKEILDDFLEERSCFIQIVTDYPGVDLPPHLRAKPSVTLQISHHFLSPLEISDELIAIRLFFGDKQYPCRIPLKAIWARLK